MKVTERILVFVPWNRKTGGSFGNDVDLWRNRALSTYGKEKSDSDEFFQVVYYENDGPIAAVRSVPLNAKIYICGHGGPGKNVVSPGSIKHSEVLTGALVGKRLRVAGLSVDFAGKIKCFNCNSATAVDGHDNYEGTFAREFADYMVSNGYTKASFQGYTASVKPPIRQDGRKIAARKNWTRIFYSTVGKPRDHRANIQGTVEKKYVEDLSGPSKPN
jgi:hypothetical protein